MPNLKTFATVLFLILLTSCNSFVTDHPEPATSTASTQVVMEPDPVVTSTEEPQRESVTTTVPEPTATILPNVTETATLAPIRATQQALADAVRVPTRAATNVPVDADDYVALTEQACRIVRENYVRDNFNGVDWEAVCAEYVPSAETLDDRAAFEAHMSALIAELGDEHSRYVPPGRFTAEFGLPAVDAGRPWPGFSVWPAREDERLLVWDVCASGPAAQAGLRRGDVILAIDGERVPQELLNFDVNALLYAPNKNEVTLTVLQGPDVEARDLNIKYGGASGCDGWEYGLMSEAPRIGYIRIPSFSGNAHTNILEAIRLLEEQAPLEGLVLDVRHNPGGNADRSLALFTSGNFGKTGPLRADATMTTYRIRGPVVWNETTPIALLIDGASHSAAEYFATAMQQSGRAVLTGMPTAGNTEGINSFNLADGSLIRLAWTTLVLPDGKTLEGVGVQPDVPVPLGEWGLRQRPDVQLRAAYDLLTD